MTVSIKVYGIKNCDKVKKARKYLDMKYVRYEFIDFRQTPLFVDIIKDWIKVVGWDALINKRSKTYRNLSELQKKNITVKLLEEQPTLIKRPVLVSGKDILFGFTERDYAKLIS